MCVANVAIGVAPSAVIATDGVALRNGEDLEDLRRRARPADRDETVVPAAGGELARGERVGLARARRLAQRGVRPGDEKRRPTTDDGDAFARPGQLHAVLRRGVDRTAPATRLRRDLRLDERVCVSVFDVHGPTR